MPYFLNYCILFLFLLSCVQRVNKNCYYFYRLIINFIISIVGLTAAALKQDAGNLNYL